MEAARVIPLEYQPPAPGPHPYWSSIATWSIAAGWITCAVAWFFIVAVDIESVLFTGPAITLIGILAIVAGVKLGSASPIAIGICHCAICVAFVVMVNGWSLGQRSALAPFTVFGALYTILMAVPTAIALFYPRLDLRMFVPGLREADFVHDLSEPLRALLGYELLHGNVVVRVERKPWSRSPLAVVLRDPLKLDEAAQQVQVPPSIRRWENQDPRYDPQAGWACTITLQGLVGPVRE